MPGPRALFAAELPPLVATYLPVNIGLMVRRRLKNEHTVMSGRKSKDARFKADRTARRKRLHRIRRPKKKAHFPPSGDLKTASVAHAVESSLPVRVRAPRELTFRQNIGASLHFFNLLEKRAAPNRTLLVDLSEVVTVETGEVLYLLARFDEMRHLKRWKLIRGTSPKKEPARTMFDASGFLDYVRAPAKALSNAKEDQFVHIKKGDLVDTQAAGDVATFVREKLGLSKRDTSGMYKILIECMTNTRDHAYDESLERPASWWMIAFYQPESEIVYFSFLDTGAGIPRTVRKRWRENLTPDILRSDSKMIISALRGELRSRTEQAHRGKGLPQIYSVATSHQVSSLSILSRRARVECRTLDSQDNKMEFHGTLYTWAIKKTHETKNR
jgi:hypothetical protein